ncbi:ras-related protein rab-5c [Anaeramoeba flamelloides]|uniref:Ras-related protein rab-5c n=1 Tax=Anaeramoeba flamelloides TaxID=1746091 RepID=A0ABQ8X649_9EUKA|nr:ras-related protein rab-5c [Anaeramoeba flamelloides]
MTILFEDFSSDEDVYEQTIIKVVMLGQSGSGKTSIVLRFIKDTFTENPKTTVGANFFIRKIVIDKKPLCVRVWDTSGQERFNSLIPLYYRNANIAILVTDIKDNSSLTKIKYWVNEMKETVKQIPIIGIAINKTDQYDETLNSQTLEQIQEYGKSLDAVVLETSAKKW